MKYSSVKEARFLSRPNRFIAYVELNGETVVAHVKNTGRCKELLLPGATVYLSESDNPDRKTKYDLIAVKKGDRLINMDSAVPNMTAPDYIRRLIPDVTYLKPEVTYKSSRFDFYAETKTDKWFIEVKGVTLEADGVVLFPDAPTLRGEKHVHELISAMDEGYKAMILFVIQMENVKYFTPNIVTHKSFGEALSAASERGVAIEAADCAVTSDSVVINKRVEVIL